MPPTHVVARGRDLVLLTPKFYASFFPHKASPSCFQDFVLTRFSGCTDKQAQNSAPAKIPKKFLPKSCLWATHTIYHSIKTLVLLLNHEVRNTYIIHAHVHTYTTGRQILAEDNYWQRLNLRANCRAQFPQFCHFLLAYSLHPSRALWNSSFAEWLK